MSPPLPSVFRHPTPQSSLIPYLLPLLPHSLPLLRLLQYHPISPTSCTFATFPPETESVVKVDTSNGKLNSVKGNVKEKQNVDLWTVVYADQARRPGTQAWVFSNHECTVYTRKKESQQELLHPGSQPLTNTQTELRYQLIALLNASRIASIYDKGELVQNPEILVTGSIHECLIRPLLGEDPWPEEVGVIGRDRAAVDKEAQLSRDAEQGVESPASVLEGLSFPITKYLIPPPARLLTAHHHDGSSNPSSSQAPSSLGSLPSNYSLSPIDPSELPILIPKSSIPRSVPALAAAPSIAIRDTLGEIQSFGFLSADGSLMHLYTEPDARRKGFASIVATELVRIMVEEGVPGDDAVDEGHERVDMTDRTERRTQGKGWFEGVKPSDAWVASDIYVGNTGSEKVATSLGGRQGWRVRWVGIDLDKVRAICR